MEKYSRFMTGEAWMPQGGARGGLRVPDADHGPGSLGAVVHDPGWVGAGLVRGTLDPRECGRIGFP